MNKNIIFIIIMFLYIIPQTAFANNNVIGGSIGYGTQAFDINNYTSNNGDDFVFDIYYRRMVTNNIGIDVGYVSSVSGIGSILISTLSDIKDASFSGPRLSLYSKYSFNNGNLLYAKIGPNFYKVDYTLNNQNESDSKIGIDLQVGWEKRFNSGLGINLGYQYGKNSILVMNNFFIGTSYTF
ncbi:outer membrane beta-barrel protein [Photobacterium carnosum]|uniref:outer membrane beta-barrel protein n=1 Tax=Photobacterium carnosum TaxID=2023717 RepID=UPI001E51A680|nr:outer membrane beta-barrel protein [Photobacterium carnosum]MCD9515604.1 outer membrane beta-barrel protein [Photobacterium carnosum]